MKVVENSPRQNARNCSFKNISWGPCPQTPNLATARSFAVRQNPQNFQVGLPPPPRNPAYAPDITYYLNNLLV